MIKIMMKYIIKKVVVKKVSKFIMNYVQFYLLKHCIYISVLNYFIISILLECVISYCFKILVNKFLNNRKYY